MLRQTHPQISQPILRQNTSTPTFYQYPKRTPPPVQLLKPTLRQTLRQIHQPILLQTHQRIRPLIHQQTHTNTHTPTNTPTNTPTFTATFDPFGLEFFCTGIRIINRNDYSAPYAWYIDGGGPAGTGVAAPLSYIDIETGYYPGTVFLYSGQQLMASGKLPTDCGKNS